MKKILVLLILSCLNRTIGNCQLLSNPSLTVEDFEIALTDTAHLGKILSKHNFEWEPNHAPQPEVIKTIRILVRRDSKYADQMKAFLEKIKIKYPNKSKRYFRNNEFYQQSGEPLIVFTNGSNIEVRTEAPDARYFNFYTVSLDLVK